MDDNKKDKKDDKKLAKEKEIVLNAPPLNVHQRWLKVMEAIGGIEKSPPKDKHGHIKYDYLQELDVKRAVQNALVEFGLVVIPSVIRHERDIFVNMGGKGNFKSILEQEFTVVNVDSPEDKFSFKAIGIGHDSGDKDTNKAYAACYKYAMTQALSIPAGADPEEDQNHEPPVKDSGGKQSKAQEVPADPVSVQEGERREDILRGIYDSTMLLGLGGSLWNGKLKRKLDKGITHSEINEIYIAIKDYLATKGVDIEKWYKEYIGVAVNTK